MENALHIQLRQVGKKFHRRWVFRNISYDSRQAPHIALTGHNGSGKSTLLRIIAGQLTASEGNIQYHLNQAPLSKQKLYQHLSWSGPHVELYPELSLQEHIALHFRFKKCLLDQAGEIIELLDFTKDKDKPIQHFSSGMKQRIKVGLALFSHSHVLLLDEPTSNMDQQNADRILDLIQQYSHNRILILASNLEREFRKFENRLELN